MGETEASLLDRIKAGLQYPLPQHAISRLIHWLARAESPAVKNWLIRRFIQRFDVDMSEAAEPESTAYPCFNAFFTRALRADTRPIADGIKTIVSPVDGRVSQIGTINQTHILQAKGRTFSVLELLAGNTTIANAFTNGEFATLYLSPRDYHRIHMPLDGSLRHMLYVPGRLFSVNPPTTRAVPDLFARNERVAAVFDTPAGPMSIVMVGALNVGSIETVWAGEITPPHLKQMRSWTYQGEEVLLKKGSELGRFNMGSTVILLFGRQRVHWNIGLEASSSVRMGQAIGEMV
ncbi:MAG TPA: archaetidylserine decarboxylase [Gammaproteobacteria bacterium]|nr:archaetidylserine decarboxylase [Gammaproteobacteria bacterium]